MSEPSSEATLKAYIYEESKKMQKKRPKNKNSSFSRLNSKESAASCIWSSVPGLRSVGALCLQLNGIELRTS